MDSDPSQIPVLPIPFEHGLVRFAASLAAGHAKIVAIGSSTTAGEGNIPAYPGRLLSFLQSQYPKANITMVNKGIGGQEAPIELERLTQSTRWKPTPPAILPSRMIAASKPSLWGHRDREFR